MKVRFYRYIWSDRRKDPWCGELQLGVFYGWHLEGKYLGLALWRWRFTVSIGKQIPIEA